jgi:hypothetical protein
VSDTTAGCIVVIDTAKGANIVISEGDDDLLKFQGAERIKKPLQPFIVIPTTAGTGSEATSAAVIADEEKGVKMLTSYKLFPNVALIDPKMTMTMPPKIITLRTCVGDDFRQCLNNGSFRQQFSVCIFDSRNMEWNDLYIGNLHIRLLVSSRT